MKESELMIGNLILGLPLEFDDSDNWVVCEVVILDSVGGSEYTIWVDSKSNAEHFSEFKPIPLTEEWLLRFGFKASRNEYYMKHWGDTGIWQSVKGFIFTYSISMCGKSLKLQYVHQLQNLHFALTQKKLKIKL